MTFLTRLLTSASDHLEEDRLVWLKGIAHYVLTWVCSSLCTLPLGKQSNSLGFEIWECKRHTAEAMGDLGEASFSLTHLHAKF